MRGEPKVDELIRVVESNHREEPERLLAAAGLAERLRARADELLDHFVHAARQGGSSWAEIGSVLGVTRQAAQQRFATVSTTAEGAPPRLDAAAAAAFAAAAREARALGHHHIPP